MNLASVLWVGLAGGVGAVARFSLDVAIRGRTTRLLPVGTLFINLSGALILGVLTGLEVFHHASTTVTLVGGTGFCGGFTTFSAASFESVRLAQQGELAAAGANLGLSVVGTLAAAAAGMALAWL